MSINSFINNFSETLRGASEKADPRSEYNRLWKRSVSLADVAVLMNGWWDMTYAFSPTQNSRPTKNQRRIREKVKRYNKMGILVEDCGSLDLESEADTPGYMMAYMSVKRFNTLKEHMEGADGVWIYAANNEEIVAGEDNPEITLRSFAGVKDITFSPRHTFGKLHSVANNNLAENLESLYLYVVVIVSSEESQEKLWSMD